MGNCRAVRKDGAEPFVEMMQSRLYGRSYGRLHGRWRAVVEPFIETIIRLPSILVLHVSRALELQIGLYGASCRAFTELRVEPSWSSVSSFSRAPCAIPPKSSAKLYIGIISLILDIFK